MKQNNKKFHRCQGENLNVTILDYKIWNWVSHTLISDDNKMKAMKQRSYFKRNLYEKKMSFLHMLFCVHCLYAYFKSIFDDGENIFLIRAIVTFKQCLWRLQ